MAHGLDGKMQKVNKPKHFRSLETCIPNMKQWTVNKTMQFVITNP